MGPGRALELEVVLEGGVGLGGGGAHLLRGGRAVSRVKLRARLRLPVGMGVGVGVGVGPVRMRSPGLSVTKRVR